MTLAPPEEEWGSWRRGLPLEGEEGQNEEGAGARPENATFLLSFLLSYLPPGSTGEKGKGNPHPPGDDGRDGIWEKVG